MVKAWKNMMPYLLVVFLDFYLLSLFIKNTGTAMIMLLAVIPLICFICSVVYGAKHAFHWQYALIVALLFVPAVFIYYNASAWIYILGYGLAALLGNLLGTVFHKR